MKKYITYYATFCLMIFLSGSLNIQNINAQAPCDDPEYSLAFASSAPDCFGDNSGTATAASTKCPCMFSGCIWEWSLNGEKLEGEEYNFHTITGLAPGKYTVVVNHADDDLYPGCILEGEVIVPEAPQFVEEITQQNIECKGEQNGELKITPSQDFQGLLSYQWSTGDTIPHLKNLAAGDYSVTITQFNGCSIVEERTISEPELALDFTYETKSSCSNESNGIIDVAITGGTPPYVYQCDGEVSETGKMDNLSAGNHQILVSDANGCALERTIEVALVNIDNPSINSSASGSVCEGSSVTLSAFNNSNVMYEWSPKEGISNPNTNLISVAPLETTEYTLTVTSENGSCQAQSSITVEVNKCDTGLFDVEQNRLNVFPNPTQSAIYLDLGDINTNAQLDIIDLTGKNVLSLQTVPNKLDLSDLPNGIYYLYINNDELQIVEKIVKN